MKALKKLLVLVLLMSLMTMLLVGCGGDTSTEGEGEEVTGVVWKIESSYGPGDQCWDIQLPLITEAITDATNGYIQFELYQPGAICEAEQIPASLANGLLDAALSAPNYCASIIPAAYAEQGVPFIWEDGQDVYETYYDYNLISFLRDEYEKAGIYYGMYVPNGAYNMLTNFPVTKADDLKGKKIRASTTYGMFVEELGGSPVVMSGGDLYMGMKLGTIDGMIYTIAEMEMSKLMEVTKYIVMPAASGSAPVNLVFSKASWDALPAEIQDTVNDTMQEIFMDIYEESIAYDESAVNASLAYGSELSEIEDLEPFYAAAEAVIDRCIVDYPAAEPGYDIILQWKSDQK